MPDYPEYLKRARAHVREQFRHYYEVMKMNQNPFKVVLNDRTIELQADYLPFDDITTVGRACVRAINAAIAEGIITVGTIQSFEYRFVDSDISVPWPR